MPRVLVVDDNPAIHDDLRKVLTGGRASALELDELEAGLFGEPPTAVASSRGYDVDSAYQGEQAVVSVRLATREHRPYAVAFVDVRMPPGIDGVQTTIQLLAADPELQIIICTAFSDYSYDDISTLLGDTDRVLILKKPFDVVEARQAAHALHRKWLLTREAATRVADLEVRIAGRTREVTDALARLEHEVQVRERMENERRLAQKLESVGQLAAGVAHEINTPIQYVSDTVQFLDEAFGDLARLSTVYREALDPEGDPSIAAVLAAAEDSCDLGYLLEQVPVAFARAHDGLHRIATIVKALKEFSHHGASAEREAVDLNRSVEVTLTIAASEIKGVADVVTALGDVPFVHASAGDVGQLLLNLVINAAHAIADAGVARGTISITTSHEGGFVTVTVTDTGCGMPDHVRERVFDPFFTTKQVGRGTGQGLAIVRSVIDRHNGTVEIESEVGVGTTFRVRLPIVASEVAAAV